MVFPMLLIVMLLVLSFPGAACLAKRLQPTNYSTRTSCTSRTTYFASTAATGAANHRNDSYPGAGSTSCSPTAQPKAAAPTQAAQPAQPAQPAAPSGQFFKDTFDTELQNWSYKWVTGNSQERSEIKHGNGSLSVTIPPVKKVQ